MTRPLFLIFFAIAYCPFGIAETILLKNGNRLQGQLLKKSDTQLVLDLGFDVVSIPADAVAEIEVPHATDADGREGGGTVTPVDGADDDVVAAASGAGLYSQAKDPRTRTVKENAEVLGEAVVQIRTPSGLGSGFVIHPAGYVITNNHVISGEHQISVILFPPASRDVEKALKRKVKIVATSPVMDLALLKIEDEANAVFAYAPIGSSDDLRSGEPVFAIGSPLGLGRSVSQGIVSVRNRVVPGGLIYIQHTAQINPGNSGGPLFNLEGEAVGVLNMKMAAIGVEGMGFAVPSSVLKLFLNNREAYAFDPRNPNSGFRYLDPPGAGPAAEPLEENDASVRTEAAPVATDS